MKRILCSLLSILFVIGIWFSVPMNASALNKEVEYLGTYEIEEQINPLYKGLIDESTELSSKPDVYYSDGLEGFDATLYSDDKEVSASVIREGMEKREATVIFYYKSSSQITGNDAFGELFSEIQELAFKETNKATQGDSLRLGYKSWSASIQGVTDQTYYYYKYTVSYEYYTTATQEAELTQEVKKVINKFGFTEETTDKEKSDEIYDYITSNVTYDYANLNIESYKLKFTPYAALINKTAVCQGYAMLYYRFAEEVGLDARVITGTSQNQNHAWNIVKIGDYYYYLDSTWDAGETNYSYYLKGSLEFPDHTNEPQFETTEFKSQYPIPEYYGTVGTEENFRYSITEEGAVITAYLGTATTLITPTTLGGETVVGIGPDVFSRESSNKVENLTISEGVVNLSESAFDYSKTLKEIHLPSTLTIQTDDYAAYAAGNGALGGGVNTSPFGCYNLETITVADGNTNIKVVDGVLYSYDGTKLILYPAGKTDITTFTVPATVEEIAPDAFRECCLTEIVFPENSALKCLHYWSVICARNLEKINLEDTNCEFIGQFALTHTSLKQLSIPATTTFIGVDAFSSGCNLNKITVAEGNTEYVVYENGLYEIDTNTLLRYACDETVKIATVKAGTERIAYGAFEQKEFLERILLPDSLVEIDNAAFIDCKNLTSITIPGNVTTLGHTYSEGAAAVFADCKKLATLTILSDACNIADDIFHPQQKFATIYANEGSTAETYANENKFEFKVLTDDFKCDTDGCKLEFAVIEGEENYLETYKCTVCGSYGYAKIEDNRDLLACDYELDFTEKTYTGNAIEPQIKSIIYKKYITETEYEIYTLVEGVDYTKEYVNNIEVSVDGGSYIKLTGMGRFNNSSLEIPFTITPIELSAPKNVKVSFVDFNTFTLSWDEIAGADGYKVYVKNGDDWSLKYKGEKNSYTTSDSNYNELYNYKIVGYHQFATVNRDSVNYTEKSVKTFASLERPQELNVINIDYGTIKAQWNSVDGADAYIVTISNSQGIIKTETVTQCQYQISGLNNGEVYYLEVVPCAYYTEGNQYVKSENIFSTDYIKTWEELSAPTNIKVEMQGLNSIRVLWSKSEKATGTRIYYKKSTDGKFENYVEIASTRSSYEFENLESGTTYEFRMVEVYYDEFNKVKIEEEEYTDFSYDVPEKLVAPKNFIATRNNETSVKLTWDTVVDATGYVIYYKKATDENYTKYTTTKDLTINVNFLSIETNYIFKIVPYIYNNYTFYGEQYSEVEFFLNCLHSRTTVENAKTSNCTEKGYSGDTRCMICNNIIKKGTVQDPTGHYFNTSEVTTKPTCTKDGVRTYSCVICKETKTEAEKSTGHKKVAILAVAPTCTAVGKTAGEKCSVCNEILVAQKDVAKIAHTTTVVNKKDATCTAEGYTGDTQCTVCKTVTAKGTAVAKLAHKTTVEGAKKATAKEAGYTGDTKCTVCGTVTQKGTTIAKLTLAAPKVTQKNTEEGISLTWGKVASAESYRVYRRTYNNKTKKYSSWTTLVKSQKGTSYVDTKVKLGTTYSYMVKAINSGVLSKGTPTKNLKYNVTPTVTVANASKGISVSWSPIANATGYEVYSSTYNAKTKKWSSFTKRATAKANAKSWTDTKAKSGTKYKYTVKALNGKVVSAYNKSGVQIVRLAQPTTKIVNASNGIKVSWGKVSGATSYEILRAEYNVKTKKWSTAKKVATAKSSATSWTDTKVKSGVQYRYTVKAVNGKIYSSAKTTSGLMFLTMPKTTVKAVKNGVTVTWTQSTGATSYEVYRAEYNKKTKKYSGYKKVATAKSTAKSYTDKTAKKGVKYKYTVKAVNNKTASAYKEVVVSR